jgi:hypothetical protein
MTEDTARFWTTVFAGVTALTVVAGGLYTLIQYFGNKDADRQNFRLQLQVSGL